MKWHSDHAVKILLSSDFLVTTLRATALESCSQIESSTILCWACHGEEIQSQRASVAYVRAGWCRTLQMFAYLLPLRCYRYGNCCCRVKMKSDGKQYSFNALFVSLKSANQARIPLWMGVLNILHEIMHSLGAQHDPEPHDSVECTPKDRVRTI